MASLHASLLGPFRRTYLYLQMQAHENPAIFYSVVLGFAGPIAVLTIPPIRKQYFGFVPVERPPTSYPLVLRERVALEGFEDKA